MMLRGVRLLLLSVLCIVLVPRAASARGPASRWVATDLPMPPSFEHHHELVPLAAPSKEHPLGTVAIIGRDHTRTPSEDAHYVLVAYAWDLAAKKVLAKKTLGRMETPSTVVSAVRAGDRILIAAGSGWDDTQTSEVVLFTIDEQLDVVAREALGQGVQPSIAVSDRWIVATFFEERTPNAISASPRDPPLHRALHAVVLDRATHTVAGARVFQGDRLLAPAIYSRIAMHAIAIRDDRAYLSLPGWGKATLVSAKLPSLGTLKTLELPGFQIPSGSAPIYVVERNLVVVTPQGWRVVSPELEIVKKLDAIGYKMAWSPRLSTLFENSTQGRLPWASVVHLDADCEQLVWAWDRPVAICGGDDSTGEPIRMFHRR